MIRSLLNWPVSQGRARPGGGGGGHGPQQRPVAGECASNPAHLMPAERHLMKPSSAPGLGWPGFSGETSGWPVHLLLDQGTATRHADRPLEGGATVVEAVDAAGQHHKGLTEHPRRSQSRTASSSCQSWAFTADSSWCRPSGTRGRRGSSTASSRLVSLSTWRRASPLRC